MAVWWRRCLTKPAVQLSGASLAGPHANDASKHNNVADSNNHADNNNRGPDQRIGAAPVEPRAVSVARAHLFHYFYCYYTATETRSGEARRAK